MKALPVIVTILIVLYTILLTRLKGGGIIKFLLILFPFNVWMTMGNVNISLIEIMILLTFFLVTINLAYNGKVPYTAHFLNVLVMLLAAYSLVIMTNSSMEIKATYKAVMRGIEFAMLYTLFIVHLDMGHQNIQSIEKYLLFPVLIVCAIGIIEYFYYSMSYPGNFILLHNKMIEIGVFPPRDLESIKNMSLEGKTIGSVFASKSALSIYIVLMLPLVFLKLLYSKEKNYFWGGGVFILATIALFLTGSRAALLAILLEFALIIMLRVRSTARIIPFILLGIAVFAIMVPQQMKNRLLFRSHESSFIGRVAYLNRSLDIIRKNPLWGGGVDSLGSDKNQSKPHNAFLYEFQTKGIASFALLAAIFAMGIGLAYRNYRYFKTDPEYAALSLWIVTALSGFLVLSQFAETINELQTFFLLAFMLAATVKLRKIAGSGVYLRS